MRANREDKVWDLTCPPSGEPYIYDIKHIYININACTTSTRSLIRVVLMANGGDRIMDLTLSGHMHTGSGLDWESLLRCKVEVVSGLYCASRC